MKSITIDIFLGDSEKYSVQHWSVMSSIDQSYSTLKSNQVVLYDVAKKQEIVGTIQPYYENSYRGARIYFGDKVVGKSLLRSEDDHIWVDRVDNYAREEIQRVGTWLIQHAVENSYALGFKGAVKLDATKNSHWFHFLKGFVPVQDEIPDGDTARELWEKHCQGEDILADFFFLIMKRAVSKRKEIPEDQLSVKDVLFTMRSESIRREIEKAKKEKREPNTRWLMSVHMFLPPGDEKWKSIINKHPVCGIKV